MKRIAGVTLCLFLALPCAVFGVAPSSAYGASKGGGLSVTPLDDEFAGQSAPLYTPPGPRGQNGGQPGDVAGNGAGNVSGNVSVGSPEAGTGNATGSAVTGGPGNAGSVGGGHGSPGSLTPGGDTKDSLVIAYLIDMARKQNKPCPSGVTPPTPPSLLFSDPLCKAAREIQGGAEPLAAMGNNGVQVATWRMFSADNAPAQRVVNGLRQAHCEALLEPYTHVGAYRDSGGWRIILATLGVKAPGGESAPAQGAGQEAAAPGAAGEGESGQAEQPSQAGQSGPDVNPAGEAPSAAVLGGFKPKEPEGAANISGQEARSLFMLLNELRAKGGACFGKEMPPAPAVAFSPELQAVAEKEAQSVGGAPASNTGMLYKGSNMTKLTLKANNHASVALDVWMVSPSQCETLLSPMFTDAGAAYEDGNWVLMLGGRNVGVPSDK